MGFLLNCVYGLMLLVASPWFVYAAWRHGKYRQGWAAKFLGQVPALDASPARIWFHAVSVGEVNLLGPVLDRLQREAGHVDVVISTTTQTGYALAKRKFHAYTVCYCPLDFTWAVRRAFQRVRPTLFVLVELELWPNMLAAAKGRGIPVAIINGRLSTASYRGYRRLGPLPRRWLRAVHAVAAHNRDSAARFIKIGVPREYVHEVGSIKFDGAESNRANRRTRELTRIANIEPADVVFLAGSTQAPEEAYVLTSLQTLLPEFPRLRVVLVPRHPERAAEVAKQLTSSGVAWVRRSTLTHAANTEWRVLLIDTIGELGAWWGTADIGFVGGSLGSRGGQNMIEPAGYGVATCFGPNTANFRDVVQLLLADQAAVEVQGPEQLTAFVRRCLQEPGYRDQLGERARRLVARQTGAADATVRLLRSLLHDPDVVFRQHDDVSHPSPRLLERPPVNSALRRGA